MIEYLTFSFLLKAFLTFLLAWLLNNFIVKPYRLLYYYQKEGFCSVYKPMISFVLTLSENETKHKDAFYSIKRLYQEKSDYKGICFTLGFFL